jgi:hypothetical protein
MQLAGTHAADRRAGHLDAPCRGDPRRRRSARRVELARHARAPGGDGGRWHGERRPRAPAPDGCGRRAPASPGTGCGPSPPSPRRTVSRGARTGGTRTTPPRSRPPRCSCRRTWRPDRRAATTPAGRGPQHPQQVPGRLGDPATVGVGGHAGEVDPAAVQFDEAPHLQPPQPHRRHGEPGRRRGSQRLGGPATPARCRRLAGVPGCAHGGQAWHRSRSPRPQPRGAAVRPCWAGRPRWGSRWPAGRSTAGGPGPAVAGRSGGAGRSRRRRTMRRCQPSSVSGFTTSTTSES